MIFVYKHETVKVFPEYSTSVIFFGVPGQCKQKAGQSIQAGMDISIELHQWFGQPAPAKFSPLAAIPDYQGGSMRYTRQCS
jgi:hypothetical protein